MITDSQLTLSVSQAVTTTAFSGNTVDLSQARNVAAGAGDNDALQVYINVEVAATAAGAATVNFQVVTSTAPNLATSTVILSQTDAIPKASLTVGTQIYVPVGRAFAGNQLGQRYLGVQYTVGTGPLTAGTFSAGITLNAADSKQFYPAGYVVK